MTMTTKVDTNTCAYNH